MDVQANIVLTGTSSFNGISPFVLTNVVFINEGTLNLNGGTMELWQNAILYNSPSGTINVLGKITATQNDQLGYMSEFHNFGTLTAPAGADGSFALNFFNRGSGSISINGQLSIQSGFFTQQDSSTCIINPGGSLGLLNDGLFLGGILGGMFHVLCE